MDEPVLSITDPALITVVIVLGVVWIAKMVLAYLAEGRRYRLDRADRLWQSPTYGVEKFMPEPSRDVFVADEDVEEPDEEPVEDERIEPVPVDPDNPPTFKVYNPRPDAPLRNCYCHNTPIEPGAEIIWWPLPDGSVRLYHREAVDVPQG